MTIQKLSKNQRVKNSTNERNMEKITEEFIGAGGKTTKDPENLSPDEIRFTLRIPKKMIEEVDKIRKDQIGSVSRNTWILQTISERLTSK